VIAVAVAQAQQAPAAGAVPALAVPEVELVKPAPAEDAPPPPKLAKVKVGAFINDIQTIDLKLHSYAVDLYVWFKWSDAAINPAESIEFTNPSELWGHVRTTNFEAPVTLPSGELYQVLRVQGRFSKKMPLYNYPFDRQTLTVAFEDSLREKTLLEYESDLGGLSFNKEMVLPGYRLGTARMEISDRVYPTDFGDPRQKGANVFSQVKLELPIQRPVMTYSLKLLLPILCVIVCAALMFILKPTLVDPRLNIGITCLLTIVALQITLNEDLPDVDYLVLMDKIYVGAYLFVIAGLGVVVRTTSLIESNGMEAAHALHKRSLLGLTGTYLAVCAVLVGLAIVNG
jgi:hypothetical protein